MRAQFVRGKDPKKALDLGLARVARDINVTVAMVWNERDPKVIKKYLRYIKKNLRKEDPGLIIIEEKIEKLIHRGYPEYTGDLGGHLKVNIVSKLDDAELRNHVFDGLVDQVPTYDDSGYEFIHLLIKTEKNESTS